MNRQTQTILYYLLPVAFWLLAIGGALLPLFLTPSLERRDGERFLIYLLPSVLVLLATLRLDSVKRHESAVEPAFQAAVLLGVAAYLLPSVLSLVIPLWIYLSYRHLMEWRAVWATLIGLALVAIWVAVFVYIGIIPPPSFEGRDGVWGLLPWIPIAAFLIAYIASAVVRHNLRLR